MNSKSVINGYIAIGIAYGLGRSWYWLGKTNNETYVMKNDRIMNVSHPHTFTSKLYYTVINTSMSQLTWPFFILNDIDYYEKSQFGIREFKPPFPFNNLKWKDE